MGSCISYKAGYGCRVNVGIMGMSGSRTVRPDGSEFDRLKSLLEQGRDLTCNRTGFESRSLAIQFNALAGEVAKEFSAVSAKGISEKEGAIALIAVQCVSAPRKTGFFAALDKLFAPIYGPVISASFKPERELEKRGHCADYGSKLGDILKGAGVSSVRLSLPSRVLAFVTEVSVLAIEVALAPVARVVGILNKYMSDDIIGGPAKA